VDVPAAIARILESAPEYPRLSPADLRVLEAFMVEQRGRTYSLSRLQRDPAYAERHWAWRDEMRFLRAVLTLNRDAHAPREQASGDGTPPTIGFLRMEDIRDAYPDMTGVQLDNLRKQLEGWRKSHEDQVLLGDENPETGRRRYAYPASVVKDKVDAITARDARRNRAEPPSAD
jgi:hypothetical protein